MEEQPKKVIVELSPTNLIVIISILGAVWLSFLLTDVIISLFIALIIASGLVPYIKILHDRLKVPVGIAIALVYLTFLSLITLLVILVFPPLIQQLNDFIVRLPRIISQAGQNLGLVSDGYSFNRFINDLFNALSNRVTDLAQGALNVTLGIFNFIVGIVTVIIFSIYLIVEKDFLQKDLLNYLPISKKQKQHILELIPLIEKKLGAWTRGQVTLCIIIGLISYVGLSFLQVEYALPLAVIAGALEIVPIIGPVISAVPAILVTAATDPIKAIFVAGLYFLIQQLENSLVVPQVMKHAVGFSPIISIIALMAGGSLFGVAGALLAIPTIAVAAVILEYYRHKKISLTAHV